MAEALLKQACGEFLEVASAGMKPGALKPFYHACAFGTWITIKTARNKKSASIFRQQRQQG